MDSKLSRKELIELFIDYGNIIEYEIISDNQKMKQTVLSVALHQVW